MVISAAQHAVDVRKTIKFGSQSDSRSYRRFARSLCPHGSMPEGLPSSSAASSPVRGVAVQSEESQTRALSSIVGPTSTASTKGTTSTRMLSLCTLAVVVATIGYAARVAYQAGHDSFVAPTILSPDSDLVIANKLKLNELLVERARVVGAIEGADAEIEADTKGIDQLEELRAKLDQSVQWTSEITSSKAVAGSADLVALSRQRQIMSAMIKAEKEREHSAQADVEAGVISRSDYVKEAQTLGQYELALLDNERTMLQRETEMGETRLTQRALKLPEKSPLTPELMVREDQRIHVQLEEVHLEANKRAKLAEKGALAERMATLDELAAELKSRPVYQAVEKRMDVAFVPYTQIDGVVTGAPVYSCVWGLFFCEQVGTVSELVAGEIMLADPWGTPQRGQYAVLNLWDRESAKSKTLRVRSGARATRSQATGSPFAAR